MERLILPTTFEVKAAAGASVATITGMANTPMLDSQGDVSVPGCFARDLRERGSKRPLLAFHNTQMPIGEVQLAETARGLAVVKGTIVLDVQAGREIFALLQQAPAALGGYSIGYVTEKERFEGGVRKLLDVSLYEVSIVVVPANGAATIDPVKDDAAAMIRRMADDIRATLGRPAPMADSVREAFRSFTF